MGDPKVTWTVLPGAALSGMRKYPLGFHRSPPVVVSPDQKWIAFALADKQANAEELWVAKIGYKK